MTEVAGIFSKNWKPWIPWENARNRTVTSATREAHAPQ